MINEAYLVGTRRDKEEIRRVMESSPTFIHHDYISLCIDLLEYLYIDDVKTSTQVEWVIEDFIELMEEDMTEQLRGLKPALGPYLRDVHRVLQFFKRYLDTVGWIPLPPNVHVAKCRTSAVMILRTINPNRSI